MKKNTCFSDRSEAIRECRWFSGLQDRYDNAVSPYLWERPRQPDMVVYLEEAGLGVDVEVLDHVVRDLVWSCRPTVATIQCYFHLDEAERLVHWVVALRYHNLYSVDKVF